MRSADSQDDFAESDGSVERAYQLDLLERLALPVLTAQAEGRLRTSIPDRVGPNEAHGVSRSTYAPLEAVGRVLSGIGPWLEGDGGDDAENARRDALRRLSLRALETGLDPDSPDALDLTSGEQCVVDMAFIAIGLLRARCALLSKLDRRTTAHLVRALQAMRRHRVGRNNHLLFAGICEALLAHMGEDWDPMRLDYALSAMDGWYAGDAVYCDGPYFHWDYYQSYVIHPFMRTICDVVAGEREPWEGPWAKLAEKVRVRGQRAAVQQVRLVAPDGSFPVIGRSITYRCGAFHHLADLALRDELPPHLSRSTARRALAAVIRRTMEAPGTFDAEGWLQAGLAGHQPMLAEGYINTGSLYLCATALLPLGLPPGAPFWADRPEPLPWEQAWSGNPIEADHALE